MTLINVLGKVVHAALCHCMLVHYTTVFAHLFDNNRNICDSNRVISSIASCIFCDKRMQEVILNCFCSTCR